jgi:hypothetical protein
MGDTAYTQGQLLNLIRRGNAGDIESRKIYSQLVYNAKLHNMETYWYLCWLAEKETCKMWQDICETMSHQKGLIKWLKNILKIR